MSESKKIEISKLSEKEKREFLLSLNRLPGTKKSSNEVKKVPTTDDELWWWIKNELGYEIPRVAVCDDHCAPFDYVCDYYFERERAILVVGGRESAKTLNTAIANYAMAETKPGCEICTFADIEAQSNKSYSYIKSFVYTVDDNGKKIIKPSVEGVPLRKETILKNGSKMEVIIGTLSGVNSPHPQKVHADEVDLQEKEIFAESRNMASTKKLRDGTIIKAQDIATSTLKSTKGIVQEIIDETEKAEKEGLKPTWKLYKACFVPGTLVRTIKGYKPIEKIISSDLVLSRGGIFRRVVATNVKNHKGKIINFKPVSGVNIRCTPDHEISAVYDDKNYTSAEKPKYGRKNGWSEKWVEADRLAKGSYVRTENTNTIIDFDSIEAPLFTKGKIQDGRNRKFLNEYHLTDGFLWAIGLFCAEGCCSQGTLTFSLHEDEKEYIQRLHDIFENLGFKVTVSKKVGSKGISVKVYSTQLSEWWAQWIGSGSENKKIPDELINLPISKIFHVAQGIIDGDGCRKYDSLNQTSAVLALQMAEISLRIKGHPSIVIQKKKGKKTCYILNNFESKQVSIGRETIGGKYKHENHRGFWDILNHKYSKVEEYKEEEYCGLVYDLTVSDDPSYVVGNTLVHNCVFEVAEEVPNCRKAPKDKRESRLKEIGKNPCELCECNVIAKAEWAENTPRTLESVCRGKFFKSRGWMPYEDVVGKFTQNSINKWESQLECRRPMADGLYLPTWSRERYCVKNWEPRPEFGKIWLGVDWGGIAPSFVIWIQGPLHESIEITNTVGSTTIIPQGSYVCFKELSEAQMGATRLADKVVRQEIQWKNRFPGFRVQARFPDPAGRQQREDWREHNPPLRTVFYADRAVEPMIECIQDLVTDHMLYVDSTNCPNLADDFESWRQEKGKEVHDETTHGPAAVKYCLKNATILVKRYKRDSISADPAVVARDEANTAGVLVGNTVSSGELTSERWRETMSNFDPGDRAPWMP